MSIKSRYKSMYFKCYRKWTSISSKLPVSQKHQICWYLDSVASNLKTTKAWKWKYK